MSRCYKVCLFSVTRIAEVIRTRHAPHPLDTESEKRVHVLVSICLYLGDSTAAHAAQKFTNEDCQISRERWERYKERFQQVKLKYGGSIPPSV